MATIDSIDSIAGILGAGVGIDRGAHGGGAIGGGNTGGNVLCCLDRDTKRGVEP